jgi:hypothetical protein
MLEKAGLTESKESKHNNTPDNDVSHTSMRHLRQQGIALTQQQIELLQVIDIIGVEIECIRQARKSRSVSGVVGYISMESHSPTHLHQISESSN